MDATHGDCNLNLGSINSNETHRDHIRVVCVSRGPEYAIDDKIDDEVYCGKVKRGNFGLHPKGIYSISQECITIENTANFKYLQAILKSSKQEPVPGSKLLAYGKVVVK